MSTTSSSAIGIATNTSASTAVASTAHAVHTVLVGPGGYRFEPNTTYAEPGDIVSFVFYPSNHSVVRAAYGVPCIPYEYTYPGKEGFYSGHFLVDTVESAVGPPSPAFKEAC